MKKNLLFPAILFFLVLSSVGWGSYKLLCHKGIKDEKYGQFTNEELFRGIVFADGPVVEHIPALAEIRKSEKALSNNWKKDKQELDSKITYRLSQTAPGFLASFRASVTSGNRVKIDLALREAYQKILQSDLALGGINADMRKILIAQASNGTGQGELESIVVQPVVQPDYPFIVLAVYQFVSADARFNEMAQLIPSKNNSLSRDSFINEIADHLD